MISLLAQLFPSFIVRGDWSLCSLEFANVGWFLLAMMIGCYHMIVFAALPFTWATVYN